MWFVVCVALLVMNYFTKKNKNEKNHIQSGLENMEQAVSTLKRYFRRTIDSEVNSDCDRTTVPQLGFKVSYDEVTSELKAKVIGARQLPTDYGSSTPRGYLVKVGIWIGIEYMCMYTGFLCISEEFIFILKVEL